MNNIPYINVECLHCKHASMLYEYHDMYRYSSTENGIKTEGYIILECPKCNKQMKLNSMELEMI